MSINTTAAVKASFTKPVSPAGFTLIEIMVSLVVVSILMAAIIGVFTSQQQTHTVQDQVVEMQQNVRAAKLLMVRDLRMAGYDPQGQFSFLNKKGIEAATTTSLTINVWDDNDGQVDTIVYAYDQAEKSITKAINPGSGGAPQLIAEGIEGLGFAYAYDLTTDADNEVEKVGNNIIWAINTNGDWYNLDEDGDGDIDPNDGELGSATGTRVSNTEIKAVRIWILSRMAGVDRGFNHSASYKVGYDNMAFSDPVQRRLITVAVKCRNIL